MKRLAMAVLASAALVQSGRADEHETPMPTNGAPYDFTYSFLAMSRYYGSIVGGLFYSGGPMSFTDLVLTRNDDLGSLRFDIGIGQKLDDWKFNKDGGNEYDFTLARTGKIGSGRFPVLYEFGICYLILHNLGHMSDDVIEDWVRLDVPIWDDPKKGPLAQAYIQPFRFDRVGNKPGDSGWFVYGGLFRNQKIGHMFNQDMVANFDYRVGWSAGVFGTDRGFAYHRLTISLPFGLGKGWTLTPSLIGQVPAGGQRHEHAFADHDRVFGTIALVKTWKRCR